MDLAAAAARLRGLLDPIPKIDLGATGTPLMSVGRTIPDVGAGFLVKRDDLTAPAFGGNKSRQLEYVLSHVLRNGFSAVVLGVSPRSNHARQLAAACRSIGLQCHIVLKGSDEQLRLDGNLRITAMLGADLYRCDPDESLVAAKARVTDQLSSRGERPFVIGFDNPISKVLASVAYVECTAEILEALVRTGSSMPTTIFLASQGATQAGLALAVAWSGLETRILGVSPVPGDHEYYCSEDRLRGLIDRTAAHLGVGVEPAKSLVVVDPAWVGAGYGIPTPAGLEAISTLAGTSGLLVDPVYTGKAAAAMLSSLRREPTERADEVMFLHTGGLPALFSPSDFPLEHGRLTVTPV